MNNYIYSIQKYKGTKECHNANKASYIGGLCGPDTIANPAQPRRTSCSTARHSAPPHVISGKRCDLLCYSFCKKAFLCYYWGCLVMLILVPSGILQGFLLILLYIAKCKVFVLNCQSAKLKLTPCGLVIDLSWCGSVVTFH